MSYDISISSTVHMSQQDLCVQVPKEFSVPLVLPRKDTEGPVSSDLSLAVFFMLRY